MCRKTSSVKAVFRNLLLEINNVNQIQHLSRLCRKETYLALFKAFPKFLCRGQSFKKINEFDGGQWCQGMDAKEFLSFLAFAPWKCTLDTASMRKNRGPKPAVTRTCKSISVLNSQNMPHPFLHELKQPLRVALGCVYHSTCSPISMWTHTNSQRAGIMIKSMGLASGTPRFKSYLLPSQAVSPWARYLTLNVVSWKSLYNGEDNRNSHEVISSIQHIVHSCCSRHKPDKVPVLVEFMLRWGDRQWASK